MRLLPAPYYSLDGINWLLCVTFPPPTPSIYISRWCNRSKASINRSTGERTDSPRVSRGFDGGLIRRAVKIVIFSPVTAARAPALHRSRRYQIATVRCRLCNSLGRAGPSGFEQDEGAKAEWVRGEDTGIFKCRHSCMEIREM